MNTRSVQWSLAVAMLALWASSVRAEPPVALKQPVRNASVAPLDLSSPMATGGDVIPVSGCASCGTSGPMSTHPGVYGWGKYPADTCLTGGCGTEGCGEAGCVPGRGSCTTCEGHSRLGRLWCAFHNALCCPDPCYEPKWSCGANAALFVDYARPVTLTRFRWDYGNNLTQPDRAEVFWAAIGLKGPSNPERRVNYHELRLYQEVAADRFSFFIDVPYRTLATVNNGGAGGFGDLIVGTKSLLLDSELLQFTFQFATSIPTGVPSRGTGVGHVTLDPSLLWAVKLYPDTYWQGQLGYTIPISGTQINGSNFAGSVLHYHLALNHILCRPVADTSLAGSIEAQGYTFTAGRVTDPVSGVALPANNQTYFSVGPGLRWCICDKLDFGFGVQFAVTSNHFADQLYRTEIRFRF
jgi:hypothetical protein